MNKKTYSLNRDIKAPYVLSTGGNNRPPKVVYKSFKKGQLVNGVMKQVNGKPAFILINGVIPIEAHYLQEVVTKDIVSSADGATEKKSTPIDSSLNHANPKIKYIDALIVGGVLGFLAVHFAEKKGYIEATDEKNKLYGACAGAILAMYGVYRYSTNKKTIIKTT